ncbi:hypothetical protein [Lentibacillus salicampi]|uniref:Uncharacterized protein n=1 Tax=Lentibacillus salicampi TaxID=175306 RepID=A0A4Y9A852_9BACI|nr:hypothetical protein [Lentibacillus salicampi]TFJ91402.1 hypothetical protein E4U82_17760 [Lentibacillus salicampi]
MILQVIQEQYEALIKSHLPPKRKNQMLGVLMSRLEESFYVSPFEEHPDERVMALYKKINQSRKNIQKHGNDVAEN